MAKNGDGKVSNGLVAASCAAVLAVYAAGYSRTRDAAQQFETQSERRPAARERTPEAAPIADAIAVAENIAAPIKVESAPEQKTEIEAIAPAAEVPATAPVPTAEAPASPAAAVEAPQAAAVPAVVPEPTPAPAPVPEAPPPPAPKWRDGTYTGWGTSRHGDIEARVVIKDGRIVDAGIATCETRYPCDVIDRILNQPVQIQSADVDYVSRATESSDAYYFGLREALEKARFVK